MKMVTLALVALLTVLLSTGCDSKPKISTAELKSSFASAAPPLQGVVDQAITQIEEGNFPAALSQLQPLLGLPLTEEQKESVQKVIEQVNDSMAKI
jgi:hypothetical protein